MAESSSRAKINFIKLTNEELTTQIALLVSNQTRIIFWKTAPRYFEGKAVEFFVQKEKTYLTIGDCNIHRELTNQQICLNFQLSEIEYFFHGKVIQQTNEKIEMILELDANCFRMEKRNRDRLQTYPIHEVYAYLKHQKNNTNNVIFFNKKEQEKSDFFFVLENMQKNKIKQLNPELNTDEEDLLGFRVEDLSSSGLSFFANTKEKEEIFDKVGEASFSLTLMFESESFTLEKAVVVYKINYINAQFSGVPMYKIGINFMQNQKLKEKIEKIAPFVRDLRDYQREFEEFIKNE